jgi:hypothetical protein
MMGKKPYFRRALATFLDVREVGFLFDLVEDDDEADLIAAWAAASRAIGTRKGEQET